MALPDTALSAGKRGTKGASDPDSGRPSPRDNLWQHARVLWKLNGDNLRQRGRGENSRGPGQPRRGKSARARYGCYGQNWVTAGE